MFNAKPTIAAIVVRSTIIFQGSQQVPMCVRKDGDALRSKFTRGDQRQLAFPSQVFGGNKYAAQPGEITYTIIKII